jgi:hypothetical protein
MFPDGNIERFKTLILRTPDADFSQTLFKDELVQSLMSGMNVDLQATRPSVLFINGEYWGIHNIRERFDKYYFASHYGVDPDNIDFLGLSLDGNEVIEGDDTHYNTMLAYIRNNDLTEDKHYQYIASQIDIDNFIDYQIAHLFLANWDWPDNNVRFWRPRTPDGKWRWVFFDCDACMIQDSYKFLYLYTSAETNDPKLIQHTESTFLLRNLIRNQTFRKQFLQKFMYHMNTTFEPGRVIKQIRTFKETYAPQVLEHIYRWNNPDSYNAWNKSLQEIELFALRRPIEMLDQLQNLYQLPVNVYPNPSSGEFIIDAGTDELIPLGIQIYSVRGQHIASYSYRNSREAQGARINLGEQPAGLYIMRMQYGSLVFNKKLQIHR